VDILMEAKHAKLKLLAALILTVAGGCVPDVEDADTLIVGPRVLAIRSEPAQVKQRGEATFTALYVSPDGTEEQAPLEWSFCKARKPLAELGPVNTLCLQDNAEELTAAPAPPANGEEEQEEEPEPILEAIGQGLATEGEIPSDACRLFGPDRPPPKDGEPSGRPVDADPTGGYYQPLRVLNTDDDTAALYEARIECGLPGAGQAATVLFNQQYLPNANPVIDTLRLTSEDDERLAIAGEDEPTRVRPGAALSLELRWDECDPLEPCEEECEPPPACDGAESYIYYDPLTRTVSPRRESMRVSWFSTDGVFRDARTGRTEQEAATTDSPNVWTAPDTEGDVTLWVVLRDDRGGAAWQTYALRIER
jgi:hypothetical protein